MTRVSALSWFGCILSCFIGCGSHPHPTADALREAGGAGPKGGNDSDLSNGGQGGAFSTAENEKDLPGTTLVVELEPGERINVNLSKADIVEIGSPADSVEWDLAFEGWDIFTNSGPSGPGDGGAFGPIDETAFHLGTAPDVPFLRADATSGAFLDWYHYHESTHSLYSRYHVYGVRSRGRLFKLQILGYYGEVLGAPVSAIYSVRYAPVYESGETNLVEIDALNATAGGLDTSANDPSGCLALDDAEMLALTPTQALASDEWDLCFRRDLIAVNGGSGGPGDVTAVDLDENMTAVETLDEVRGRNAESEFERFADTEYDELTDAAVSYQGDHIVTAFSKGWYAGDGDERTAATGAWLVRSADGRRRYVMLFLDVEGDARSGRRIALQIREVQGTK